VSQDVADPEEHKEEEDPANVEDESPEKSVLNMVDIPSLVGSVQEDQDGGF
jgi:hypothetical protein